MTDAKPGGKPRELSGGSQQCTCGEGGEIPRRLTQVLQSCLEAAHNLSALLLSLTPGSGNVQSEFSLLGQILVPANQDGAWVGEWGVSML